METNNKTADSPLMNLERKRARLIADFFQGKTSDFPQRHTRFLDAYFHETYENSAAGLQLNLSKNPFAVIALGGYGRQEQCIHSDIDLLFLFERTIPSGAAELIQEIVYPMWDLGLEVGHTTQTLDGCLETATADIERLTSLLDARFLCGMSNLYSRLMHLLRERFFVEQPEKVIDLLIRRNLDRHAHFGDCTYLLEPNLKEGQGGLRDYHTMLWIARIRSGLQEPRDLEYTGILSHGEYRTLKKALGFIWDVRNRLHHAAERKCDQLYFRHQEKLARDMKFRKENDQQPVERFLGELHRHMTFLKRQQWMRVYELENERKQRGRKRNFEKILTPGLEIRKGMLQFAASRKIPEAPELLIRIFEESARLKIPLGAEANRLVRDFLHLVDAGFRTSISVRVSFERILLTPARRFNVLEAMSETGILTAWIPQLNEIADRIQYDEYHLYPVDKHSLKTVRNIKQFGTADDPTEKDVCGKIYADLTEGERILLLWASLLHDIGKGKPGGNHSVKGVTLVRAILTEKGYPEDRIDTVCFLVREHLLLVKMATRRDIQDEETAILCARIIQEPNRLRMLYLLTVADSAATGPKAWNTWVAALLEGLYLNVLGVLKHGELASHEAVEIVEQKREGLLASAPDRQKEERKKLLDVMSPRYLLYTSAADIEKHLELFRKLHDAPFVWEVNPSPDGDTRTVAICGGDLPGLFSKIAGALTLNGIDTLDAQIYTWRNNIALDVFSVKPPRDLYYEDQKWDRAAEDLKAALRGELDLSEALRERRIDYGMKKPRVGVRPHQVKIDNDASRFFTIVEVFTYDFPGLLFGITDALFKCRLDIWIAKIATNVDQVVDVFYVRDFDGQKVESPDQVAAIKEAVEKMLTASWEETSGGSPGPEGNLK